ncbi:MAG: YdeI/OmpD-associated family protein [Bacteroidia bacterium]
MLNQVEFKSYLNKFNTGLGLHYIHVPELHALSMASKFPHRVFCTVNDAQFPAAIVKHGEDGFIIQMGKQTLKSIKVDLRNEFEVLLVTDTTEHGYEIPEEFKEYLKQDEEGRVAWEKLTSGNQRSFLHYLCSAKTSDTRIKRSNIILKRAKEIIANRNTKR